VDGFRFDLATTLTRGERGVNMTGRFLTLLQQDPLLCRVKLIAEPWDLGDGGYRVGAFPPGWSEWNDKYRDTSRKFWRGEPNTVADLASRLSGSSDIYENKRRSPAASINFITAHDGFTLADLTRYAEKHNAANGQNNQDGTDSNHSHNWGIEGPSTEPGIEVLRQRMQKNLLATLLFSQGVPMLLGGDEMGQTQGGNNNAYCQDNATSWINWQLSADNRQLLETVRTLLALRRANPVLRRRTFFRGQPVQAGAAKDLTWLRPDGKEMQAQDWQNDSVGVVGMLIDSLATDELDERGRLQGGDTLLIVLNAQPTALTFVLPQRPQPGAWYALLNTAQLKTSSPINSPAAVEAHSLVLFTYCAASQKAPGAAQKQQPFGPSVGNLP
jgi:isoamylase